MSIFLTRSGAHFFMSSGGLWSGVQTVFEKSHKFQVRKLDFDDRFWGSMMGV